MLNGQPVLSSHLAIPKGRDRIKQVCLYNVKEKLKVETQCQIGHLTLYVLQG